MRYLSTDNATIRARLLAGYYDLPSTPAQARAYLRRAYTMRAIAYTGAGILLGATASLCLLIAARAFS